MEEWKQTTEKDKTGVSKDCPCKRRRCERRTDCEACRKHHEGKKYPPFCERKAEK